MATEAISVEAVIPAPPERIFQAWLNGAEHGAMTGGGKATFDAATGAFTAWDGYIRGQTLQADPSRIVQSWRSTEFPTDAPDSRLVVKLTPEGAGTRVRIEHAEIPAGQGEGYLQGWKDFYFTPMTTYFASLAGPASRATVVAEELASHDEAADQTIEAVVVRARAKRAATQAAEANAAKKAAPKKAAPKKAAPKKAAPAKKAAPKKAAPAKKAAPKKAAPAKKAAAKKAAPAKKVAPKKVARKASTKKPAAKKPARR